VAARAKGETIAAALAPRSGTNRGL